MIKRLSLSLMAVALIAMLVSAATFALFTATTGNESNTFTAGTVTLGQPASTPFTITNLAPGDSGNRTYTVTYTGSLDAWIGLDTTTAGGLFGGTSPLQFTIKRGATTFDNNASDQVVGLVSHDDALTFDIAYSMPLGADNSYQGQSATVTMLVKAVQAKNNTNST
ncbi:MAG: TasA family protein, partial [Bacillota bacterium]